MNDDDFKKVADFTYAIKRLIPLKLREESIENKKKYLKALDISFDDTFVCLGEVGTCGHYIIMRMSRGNGEPNIILPGMYHIERFRPLDEYEEL